MSVEARLAQLESTVSTLQSKVDAKDATIVDLQRRILKAEDIEQIRRLFHVFGYYFDKSLYHKVCQCFADHPDTKVFVMGGVWKGLDGVKRIYEKSYPAGLTHGRLGPAFGLILDHALTQEVITVSDDGKTAYGRHRAYITCAQHDAATQGDAQIDIHAPQRNFEEGALYENKYIKLNGQWKILEFRYRPIWHKTFGVPWSRTPVDFVRFLSGAKTFPEDPDAPDEYEAPGDSTVWIWPDTHVLPYHYPDPSGKWLTDDERVAKKVPLKVYTKDGIGLNSGRKR